jgi:hypothetical protein
MSCSIDSWLAQFEQGAITYMELFEKISLHLTEVRDDIAPVLAALRGHANADVQFLARTMAESLGHDEERASAFPMSIDPGMAGSEAKK